MLQKAGDAEAIALWRKAITGKRGGDRRSKQAIKRDNITIEPKRGTSRAYTRASAGATVKEKRPRPGALAPPGQMKIIRNLVESVANSSSPIVGVIQLRSRVAQPKAWARLTGRGYPEDDQFAAVQMECS